MITACDTNLEPLNTLNWLQLWYKETLKINAGVKDATRWKSTTVFTGV